MQIPVASQNRREVTAHLGRCRRFWIYQVEGEAIRGKRLIELPKEQSLHESHGASHPLDEVQVIIAGGMGEGMARRLTLKHVEGVVITPETRPEAAVLAYLAGTLERGKPEGRGPHARGHGHHEHGHDQGQVVKFVRTLPASK